MPSKENLHGVRDHYKRNKPVSAPKTAGMGFTEHKVSSNLGPLGQQVLTKGANATDSGLGLLPNSTSQAQPHRKLPSSIKWKKNPRQGLKSITST